MKGGVSSFKKIARIFKKYNVDDDKENDLCNAIMPREKCVRDDSGKRLDDRHEEVTACNIITKEEKDECTTAPNCFYNPSEASDGMPPCISNKNNRRIWNFIKENKMIERTDKEKITQMEFLKKR